MYNSNSITKVNKSFFGEFRKPLHGSYCFSSIPDLIKLVLGIDKKNIGEQLYKDFVSYGLKKKYDKVVLLFVDGFGWEFFEELKSEYPLLKSLDHDGLVAKLTSQFPSTTAAHVTTINSGKAVGETGVFEWRYYEPELDEMIMPLMYSLSETEKQNSLVEILDNPEKIFPFETIYSELENHGIKSNSFLHSSYADSPYNEVLSRGTNIFKYKTLSESFIRLAEELNNSEKSYYFVYAGDADSIAHSYGPKSNYHYAELENTFDLFEKHFLNKVRKDKQTLLLLTSDHGHIQIKPEETFYINKIIPNFKKYIRTNKNGQLLVPAGSPRDMFLYIKKDYLEECKAILENKLKGKAKVYFTKDLIDSGIFGKVSKRLIDRVGDIVILPERKENVWWYSKNHEVKKKGMHGGMSPLEMEIPLIAFEI